MLYNIDYLLDTILNILHVLISHLIWEILSYCTIIGTIMSASYSEVLRNREVNVTKSEQSTGKSHQTRQAENHLFAPSSIHYHPLLSKLTTLEFILGELNAFLGDMNNKLTCTMKWLLFKVPCQLHQVPTV